VLAVVWGIQVYVRSVTHTDRTENRRIEGGMNFLSVGKGFVDSQGRGIIDVAKF